MRTKDYEIGFIVVAAVAVITLVLISFVTPTVTVAAQIVSYLSPQSVDAGFIPLSIEEDSDTSRKQSQQSSGSLRESATGTKPCDPEATICIVGPERPGTEGKTEKRKDKSDLTPMFYESPEMIRLSKANKTLMSNKKMSNKKMVTVLKNELRLIRKHQ